MSIIAIPGYIGTMTKIHTLRFLLGRNIFVQIGRTVNQTKLTNINSYYYLIIFITTNLASSYIVSFTQGVNQYCSK